jgi:hypothetical protein
VCGMRRALVAVELATPVSQITWPQLAVHCFGGRGSSVHGLPSLSHPKRLIPAAILGVKSSSLGSNLLKGSLGLANSQDDASYALPPLSSADHP